MSEQLTANDLISRYRVTRAAAARWFRDGLIPDATRGPGGRDQWVAPFESLAEFEKLHMLKVSVTGPNNELLDLPAPFNVTASRAAESLNVSNDVIKRWIYTGYFPGAIRLPGKTGAWRIPAGGLEKVDDISTMPELYVNMVGAEAAAA